MNVNVNPERQRLLIALALAAVTLILLAAGISSIDFTSGTLRTPDGETLIPEEESTSGDTLQNLPGATPSDNSLIAAVAIGVALLLYSAIRWKGARITIVILLVLTLAMFAAANWLYNARDNIEQDIPLDMSALENVSGFLPEGEEVAPTELVTDPPDFISFLITFAIVTAIFGVTFLLWRQFRPVPKSSRELIALGAENTLSALRSGMDFRDAISKCYFDMSEALRNDRGLVRREDMTPREFEALLMKTELPTKHLQRLTRLFEQVRYGGHRVTQRDQMEAVAALEALVAAVKTETTETLPAAMSRAQTY